MQNGPKPSATRLDCLDGMRGLAALVVFLHHALNIFYPTLAGLERVDKHPHMEVGHAMHVLPLGFAFNGPFAVCFFFVLSGFVLTLQVRRAKTPPALHGLLVQRFLRLFPLVFVASLMGWLTFRASLHGLDTLRPFSGIDASDVFSPALFEETSIGTWLLQTFYSVWHNEQARGLFDPVLWSIGAEFQGSVLMYVILCSLQGLQRAWLRYMAATALIVLFIGPFGMCFIAGMAVAERFMKNERIVPSDRLLRVLLVAALVWAGVCPYKDAAWLPLPVALPDTVHIVLNTLSASIMLSAGVQLAGVRALFARPVARFLGHVSYGLYVIHMPFLYAIAAPLVAWLALALNYDVAVIFASTLALALALGAGYLLIEGVDAPLNRISKQWVKRVVLP